MGGDYFYVIPATNVDENVNIGDSFIMLCKPVCKQSYAKQATATPKTNDPFWSTWKMLTTLHSMNVPSLWYYTTRIANCLSY